MKVQMTLIRVAIVLLLIGPTGCIPGITWLPDSSGFVYTAGNEGQHLVLFDLTKKTQRTILSDTKLHTAWPAVSPDGKSLAVARLILDKDKGDSVQLFVYDLEGTSRKQSKAFSLSQPGQSENRQGEIRTELYWGPPEKIVISVSTSPPKVGIYDVKTDQLKILKDAFPAAFGGRPIRPDGKGFVVTKWRDQDCIGMALIDWDGKEQAIAMKPIGDDSDKKEMLTWPYMFTSSWQGGKALLSSSKGRVEIDTDKLVAKLDWFKIGEPNGENSVRQQYTFPVTQNILRLVDWSKESNGSQVHMSRLEMLDGQKRTQTLIEDENIKALFFSPNGKLVAVRCLGQSGGPQDSIWVIGQTGQVLTKIKVQD
jgi:hypothetical protein